MALAAPVRFSASPSWRDLSRSVSDCSEKNSDTLPGDAALRVTTMDRFAPLPPFPKDERRSPPLPYTARLASWSQPDQATQAGFRVGHGTFSPVRAPRLAAQALALSNTFFENLPPPPIDAAYLSRLPRPFAVPQCLPSSSSSPFNRESAEELEAAGLPTAVFVRFLDVVNTLLLAGAGNPKVSTSPRMSEPAHFPPPPNATARPAPLETFLAAANRHWFEPRRLHCRVLPTATLERLLLPADAEPSDSYALRSLLPSELLAAMAMTPSERRSWIFRRWILPTTDAQQQYPPQSDVLAVYSARADDIANERARHARSFEKEGRLKALEALAKGKRDKVERELKRMLAEGRSDLYFIVENM